MALREEFLRRISLCCCRESPFQNTAGNLLLLKQRRRLLPGRSMQLPDLPLWWKARLNGREAICFPANRAHGAPRRQSRALLREKRLRLCRKSRKFISKRRQKPFRKR